MIEKYCKNCGKKLSKNKNTTGLCLNCYLEKIKVEVKKRYCSKCGKEIALKNKTGLCIDCYIDSKRRPKKYCSKCGTLLNRKNKHGICFNCRRTKKLNTYTCEFCKKEFNTDKKFKTIPICDDCKLKYKIYLLSHSVYELYAKVSNDKKYCSKHGIFYTKYCPACKQADTYISKCKNCGVIIGKNKTYCQKCLVKYFEEKYGK